MFTMRTKIDVYQISHISFHSVLDNMFLTTVRHEVNNLESSFVAQELEVAMNLAL